jgi:hypothetical protein
LSKQAVPGGTGDSRKEIQMSRFLTTVTLVMMLAASGAYAQQPAGQAPEQQRYRTESQWSPLTYEYLGATPKVDLSRLFAPRAAKAEADKAGAGKAAAEKAAPADSAHARAPQGKATSEPSTH